MNRAAWLAPARLLVNLGAGLSAGPEWRLPPLLSRSALRFVDALFVLPGSFLASGTLGLMRKVEAMSAVPLLANFQEQHQKTVYA